MYRLSIITFRRKVMTKCDLTPFLEHYDSTFDYDLHDVKYHHYHSIAGDISVELLSEY